MAGNLRRGLSIAVIVAVLDQATKYWLVHLSGIAEAGGRIVLGPFVDLVYLRNPGISYSMFEFKGAAGQGLLTALALAVSAGIVIWLKRTESMSTGIGLGLVLGGAIGNAIDRPFMGGVVDFVSLHAGGFNWYVFNLADCGVVAGAAILLYESVAGSRKTATDGV
jgi:signal peptidase II